ncbi:unnamed protein product [Ilex paraguariensis]|uniref:Pentatricopeptide repeat-containing protein n=1 Tax=Ilex paraguariensis TaxID=185542 RepID=A0ABC8UBY7_9AQUA
MDDMKTKGVKPNTNTYNAMFKGLQEINWLEKALQLMDQMTEQACNPDYITMEVLTDWLSVVNETEKLRNFVQGYEVSASIAYTLTKSYASKKCPQGPSSSKSELLPIILCVKLLSCFDSFVQVPMNYMFSYENSTKFDVATVARGFPVLVQDLSPQKEADDAA